MDETTKMVSDGLGVEILSGAASFAKNLCAAQKEAGWLKKDKRNSAQKFDYTSSESVVALSKVLAENGIAFLPSFSHAEQNQVGKTRNGQPINQTIGVFEYTLIDSGSGYEKKMQWRVEAFDFGDKGYNKAATVAAKFFLQNLLLIPRGDAPDTDSHGAEYSVAEPAAPDEPGWVSDVMKSISAAETHSDLKAIGANLDWGSLGAHRSRVQGAFTSKQRSLG